MLDYSVGREVVGRLSTDARGIELGYAFEELVGAICELGKFPGGYCFCCRDRRVGKVDHEPECARLRLALERLGYL